MFFALQRLGRFGQNVAQSLSDKYILVEKVVVHLLPTRGALWPMQ